MFTRTFSCITPIPKDAIMRRLMGSHVNIHQLDFEVVEKNEALRIIAHAEQVDEIKSLPITYLDFDDASGETKVKATFKLRKLDAGGPMLIFILCGLLLVASAVLGFVHEQLFSIVTLIACVATYTIFRLRLEKSYFDYVRKIQSYIFKQCYVPTAE